VDKSEVFNIMTEKERMLSGELYIPKDDELGRQNMKARKLIQEFNTISFDLFEERNKILIELLGQTGENIYIEPPFRCDYGCNIKIGNNFYANYDCIFIDVNKITIGDNAFFGPRVCLYTAGHPIDAQIRNTLLEFGKKICIGNNVWIGGNTVVNPGVCIGDNTVIGSGSVVTKDIPSDVIAVGNPCRVLRKIDENDRQYWQKKKDKYFKDKKL